MPGSILKDILQEQTPLRTISRKVLVNTVAGRPEKWVVRKYIRGLTLNVGSKTDKLKGTVSIDRDPGVFPDIVCDAQNLYLYYNDSTVDCIIAAHLLEHLKDPGRFVDLCHRLLKPGGHLCLILPDFEAQGSVGYHRTIDHYQEMVKGRVWAEFRRDTRWSVVQFNKLSFWYFTAFDIVLEKR